MLIFYYFDFSPLFEFIISFAILCYFYLSFYRDSPYSHTDSPHSRSYLIPLILTISL